MRITSRATPKARSSTPWDTSTVWTRCSGAIRQSRKIAPERVTMNVSVTSQRCTAYRQTGTPTASATATRASATSVPSTTNRVELGMGTRTVGVAITAAANSTNSA